MNELVAILSEFENAASLLAFIFAIIGLLVSLGYILFSGRDIGIKLVGSIFVVGLCFAANNAFVYPLGILIVATLVTELQFLEKIAAILWNRKEYWDYLIGNASPKEVENKVTKEIAEQSPPPLKVGSHAVQEALAFQRAALQALSDPGVPLVIKKVDVEQRLQGGGRSYLLDGVALSYGAVYIVEVKAALGRNMAEVDNQLNRVAYQLDAYASAYSEYLERLGARSNIRKILIVPEAATMRDSIGDVAILRFDAANNRFTNFDAIKRIFPAWNWKEA